MHITIDILLTVLGVIAAPFLVQGIRRSRTRAGRWLKIALGVGLVAFFLVVWGQFGRDPLQIVYCWAVPSAPTCPAPPADTLISGAWRLDEAGSRCDRTIRRNGNDVVLEIEGLRFREQIERVEDDAVYLVVTGPEQAAGQRYRVAPDRRGDTLTMTPLLGGPVERWTRCAD
ncbi:MAG: hypothetical protein ACI8U3_001269 [Brevundimonas sp.]|jgi:hypothetical protein|uniref:hypothetical protein n=1 Tax=Brevundimonas sp. TaxID=1871086 RepID=UPI0039E5302F